MIIAQISHGLGNQMFQYAAARSLATRRNAVLKIDLDHYTENSFRRFGLDAFNLSIQTASWFDMAHICPIEALERAIRRIRPFRLRTLLLRVIHVLGFKSPYHSRTDDYIPRMPLPPLMIGNVASERFYHFDPDVLICPDGVCLAGYWQSERYFSHISAELRKEFTFKAPLSPEGLRMARLIQERTSVSLHIRRGDKATLHAHCATDFTFCVQAMSFFRQRTTDPTFFVFSDDWGWIHEHLEQSDRLIFVEYAPAGSEHEDLHLMSSCKHNIICSSTFSWWGAWLNSNPDKIVLHPGHRNWVNLVNYDTSDLFPAAWLPLDTVPTVNFPEFDT